ncbi:HK97 family phage prohead protease [Paenibacillus sp. OV219]|uniref:HK97 family phage prohead protease n=1 Tax=Paenibacillus sp. OV219 TaxID=1884377 RepID=UPI0008C70643|nr:HK97 family phage prohead protease [Paenibacillus sp. OV219]SEM81517.1 prohead peptidase. Unknown type peptidase. MEROPS family U35 [Paenibacillus sp. OV219]
MSKEKVLRFIPADNIEVRSSEGESTTRTIAGYVVKFNQRSQLIWGEFYERVAKGAFSSSLRDNTIKAFWNHRSDFVLGSTKNATLRLWEDDVGLRFEIDLPNNSWGNDAFESIQRGDVDGVSFGFYVRADTWQYLKEEDVYERTLLDVNLFEVSPTPFPAYTDSEVSQRSINELGITSKEQRKRELQQEKMLIELELDLLDCS